MEQYMMIFRMNPASTQEPTEAELTQMHEAWGAFIGNIAIQEKLVSTHRLGASGNQISADGTSTSGIHLAKDETISGNMIVKALNLEEATEMAKNCPILHAGGSVEVRSIDPM